MESAKGTRRSVVGFRSIKPSRSRFSSTKAQTVKWAQACWEKRPNFSSGGAGDPQARAWLRRWTRAREGRIKGSADHPPKNELGS